MFGGLNVNIILIIFNCFIDGFVNYFGSVPFIGGDCCDLFPLLWVKTFLLSHRKDRTLAFFYAFEVPMGVRFITVHLH